MILIFYHLFSEDWLKSVFLGTQRYSLSVKRNYYLLATETITVLLETKATFCESWHTLWFFKYFLLILQRESKGERKRETSICYSTYICIHWLIIICALSRRQTCNLGVSRQCSKQLNYLARATHCDILTNVICLGLNINLT